MIRRHSNSTSLLACALLAAGAGLAHAADKPTDDTRLKAAFGSTIVSTYPDGRQAQLWLMEDGAYKAEGRRKDTSDGTWQIKDNKLCLKQRHPFAAPFSYCTPVPTSLDRPWTGKAYTGEQINIKLVKGMHGRDAESGQTHKAGGEDGRTGKTAG